MTTPSTKKVRDTVTVDITGLSAEEAASKLREALGAPILLPTDLEPHRVCAKRSKKDKATAMHGIAFRRVGMRMLLRGDAELVPETGVVMPAKAAKLIASADEDMAALWFVNGRMRHAVRARSNIATRAAARGMHAN